MLVAMEEDRGGCVDFFRMSIILAGEGQSQLQLGRGSLLTSDVQ
jgi:hypothetical protein